MVLVSTCWGCGTPDRVALEDVPEAGVDWDVTVTDAKDATVPKDLLTLADVSEVSSDLTAGELTEITLFDATQDAVTSEILLPDLPSLDLPMPDVLIDAPEDAVIGDMPDDTLPLDVDDHLDVHDVPPEVIAVCDPQCGTCDGADCRVCRSGYYLFSNKCYPNACPAGSHVTDWTNRICSACAAPCADGWFENVPCTSNNDRVCMACDPVCVTCAWAGSGGCTRCHDGFFVAWNQCVACSGPCAPGTFLSQLCEGDTDRVCTTCRPACGVGTYESVACTPTTDRVCSECEADCARCTSAVTCTACRTGYYLELGDCFSTPPPQDVIDADLDAADADASDEPVPEGWLYTSGNRILRNDPVRGPEQDPEIILRGVSLIDITTVSTDGGYAAQIDRIVAFNPNINIVRMPVYPWDTDLLHSDTKPIGPWNTDNAETLFATYLDPAVQYAKSQGLYVIVDLHYMKDISATSSNNATVRAFWNDMAPRYANDHQVLFEVYNEPIFTGGTQQWDDWKPIVQEFVDLIRTHAPYNILLVSGPQYTQNIAGCATNPVDGTNIVYVGHLYDFHYDPEGIGWSVAEQIATCKAAYPVFLTEWGGDDPYYMGLIADVIREHGLSATGFTFHNFWWPNMFNGGGEDVAQWGAATAWGAFIDDFLDGQ